MNEEMRNLFTAAIMFLPNAISELESAQTSKPEDVNQHIEDAKSLIRKVVELVAKVQQSPE